MGEQWIAPFITGSFLLLVGIVAGLVNLRNRRRGNVEAKAPDVNSMWARQDLDRRLRYAFEDAWRLVRSAFRSYIARVTAGGSTTPTQQELFALDQDPTTEGKHP